MVKTKKKITRRILKTKIRSDFHHEEWLEEIVEDSEEIDIE